MASRGGAVARSADSARWQFAVLGAAVGLAVPFFGARSALAFGAAAVVVALLGLGWRGLVSLLVALTYITVVRVNVLGVHLRPEHFVLPLCFVAAIRAGRGRALAAAATDRTVVLYGFFVVWSTLITLMKSPQPGESLLICAWLALDWLMLVLFLGTSESALSLARLGLLWAGVAAVVAVALWVAAQVLGTHLGVSPKTVEAVPAASGFSFEANLLGATMALWAFVALTGVRSVGRRTTTFVLVAAAGATALSFTRAAVVALAAGLVVWSAIGGEPARRRAARVVVGLVVAMAVAIVVAPGVVKPLRTTVTQALNFSSGTGLRRAQGWKSALEDIKGTAWVTGLGTNSFGQRHLDPTLPTTPTPAYLANLPLQVLYDTGLVGVGLIVATVLSMLTRRRLQDGRALGLMTVYVICAAATSPFWYGTTWILVAIAVLDRRTSRPAPASAGAPLVTVT